MLGRARAAVKLRSGAARVVAGRHVDVIAHPTGRLLGKRPGYEIDLAAVEHVVHELSRATAISDDVIIDLRDVTFIDSTGVGLLAQALNKGATLVIDEARLRVRLPGGTITTGKVFFKSAEADFATQRDVGRRKRDIRTIVLKVRLENPKGAYVPGMTAEVLVSPDQLKGTARENVSAEQHP